MYLGWIFRVHAINLGGGGLSVNYKLINYWQYCYCYSINHLSGVYIVALELYLINEVLILNDYINYHILLFNKITWVIGF